MNSRKPNRLINEKSLYLLQHAFNPIDWYPWCDEAFQVAKEKDRPIFLSIGYSSCHWCHVMEKESFENEEIAKILNENFVSIKVDREEFPDVDNFYMTFVQLTTGSGGWPLSVFCLPDKTPFFGGTYFPPEPRYGKPSFKEVLLSILEFYKKKKSDLNQLKEQVENALQNYFQQQNPTSFEIEKLKEAFKVIHTNYDWSNGGWGKGSKFPMFPILNFLVDYYLIFKDETALKMVEHNLRKILTGGIYDHIGGGMHRYTVDNQWIVPHFEKMLYDNAQLIELISRFLLIKDDFFFKQKLYDTIEFLIADLKTSDGGFLTAIDADSEGEEGKFYLWSIDELKESLKNIIDENLFFEYFQLNLFERGSFSGILSLRKEVEQKDLEKIKELSKATKHLNQLRNRRTPPARDNKILTDLNSLLISALTFAYRATEDEKFLSIAIEIFNFINQNLFKDGELFHSFVDNEARIEAYADDYFSFVEALVNLYEVTYDEEFLSRAYELIRIAIDKFLDKDLKTIFQQSSNSDLPLRTTDVNDYAKPSATSTGVYTLLKLGKIFEDDLLLDLGNQIIEKYFGELLNNPFGYGKFLSAVLKKSISPKEIILVEGDDNSAFNEFKSKILKMYSPDLIFIYKRKLSKLKFSYLAEKNAIDNKLTLYLCENFTCQNPITDPSLL